MNRLAPLLILLVTACASAQVMRVDSVQRPATKPDSVRVFLEEPDQPYSSIALIEISDQGWGLSLDALRTKAAKEAAKLGGEGVILGRQTAQSGAVILPIGDTWYAGTLETSKLVEGSSCFATSSGSAQPLNKRLKLTAPSCCGGHRFVKSSSSRRSLSAFR